jgi:pantetheine-phosphate adenylyltransferase
MEKTAVFPGSFDPFTFGHKNIVERALPLFDKIIIAIGVNAEKKTMFSLEERISGISSVFNDEKKVEVKSYAGLTVDFCLKNDARFIIRGVRNNLDFEYEKAIAQMNKELGNGIETFILCPDPEYSTISSTVIRDVFRNGHDISKYVPFLIEKND